MAETVKREVFNHAVIDCKDMTIAEYMDDTIRVYSLIELLKRWDSIPDITLIISRVVPLPEDGGDDNES